MNFKSFFFVLFILFHLDVLAQPKKIDSIFQYLITHHITQKDSIHQKLYFINNDSVSLKRFAEFSQNYNFPEGELYAYNALGKLFRVQANYAKAIYYHQKAYNLASALNIPFYKIYSLNMLGVIYRRMDAVKSALTYHNKALNLALNSNSKDRDIVENIAISHNSIGNIYLLLQRDDLALNHFEKALEIEKKYNNKLGLAINYQNIGSIFERKGDFVQALQYYQKSLEYNNKIHSKVGKVICYTSIGNLYLKQGKTNEAIQTIQPALTLSKELGDAYYLADVYANLGKAFLQAGEYLNANKYLTKALKISLEKKLPSIAQEVYRQFSVLKQKNGDYEAALAYYKKYNEKQNEVLNEKNRQLVADVIIKQIKLENQHKIQALGEKNQQVTKKLNRTKKTFYYTLSLSLLLLVLGFIFYKQHQLNNARKLMNLEQNLLRVQMNPHFIFNSLNSLKMFIIQNRPKEAVMYLSMFSKLVRAILQSSIDKDITLKEEIDTLKKYVSIENLRFSNQIDFEINVSPDLDLKTIYIPPLLTQPFIENALWHGLSPKEGEKKLTINIYPKNNTHFIIEIIDNGIGRKRAGEIKQGRTFKKKSVGIKLSEERLSYFAKRFKSAYNINFVDLYDAKGNPIGTKVILKVPYQKIIHVNEEKTT